MIRPARHPFYVFLLICGIVFTPSIGFGDIYKYVDANGVVNFTDTPISGGYKFFMKERKQSGKKDSVSDLIKHYSSVFHLEDSLVRAVIKVESDYDPNAQSEKGAKGLMQLIPETAHDMNVADPFNPEDNIRGGSRYLRMMLDQFGTLDLALAAYNAGPAAVRRHGGIPPYEETRNYVQKVKKYLRQYRQGLSEI